MKGKDGVLLLARMCRVIVDRGNVCVVYVDHEATVFDEDAETKAADAAKACDEANAAISTDVVAAASPALAVFVVCSSHEVDVASARCAAAFADDDTDNDDDSAVEEVCSVCCPAEGSAS